MVQEVNPGQKSLLAVDLSDLLKPYSNQWVALLPDESKVVAAGMTPVEAINQAKLMGVTNPVLTHVPKNQTPHML